MHTPRALSAPANRPVRLLSGLVAAVAVLSGLGVSATASRGSGGRASVATPVTHIYSIGVGGHNERDLSGDPSASDTFASVSPDRTKIAFLRAGSVWLMNADGTGQRLLLEPLPKEAFDFSAFRPPAWSPDSSRLAIDGVSTAGCGGGDTKCAAWYVLVVDLQGKLVATLGTALNVAWSPNGRQIAYEQGEDGGFSLTPEKTQIAVSNLDGSNQRLISTGIAHRAGICLGLPVWSPDGRRIAFVKEDCADYFPAALYVTLNGTTKRQIVSTAGRPVWSPRGTRLAYLRGLTADSSLTPARGALILARADGTRPKQVVPVSGDAVWSADGSRLALTTGAGRRLSLLNTTTLKLQTLAAQAPDSAREVLAFSRDGKRIFYLATAGGAARGQGRATALHSRHDADGDVPWPSGGDPRGKRPASTSSAVADSRQTSSRRPGSPAAISSWRSAAAQACSPRRSWTRVLRSSCSNGTRCSRPS